MKLFGTKKQIVLIVLTIIVLIITSLIDCKPFIDINLEIGYTRFMFIVIPIYIWILLSSYLLKNEFDFYFGFIFVTLLFYFGGQILVSLGYYDKLSIRDFSVIDGRIPNEFIFEAMKSILIYLLCIHIGYLFSSLNNNRKYKISILNSKIITKESLRKVSILLICISIFPMLIRMSQGAIQAQTLGHLTYRSLKVAETGVSKILSFIMGWFIPSCYLLLICSKKRSDDIIAYSCILLYVIIYILTGSRYQLIEIIVVIVLINIFWKNNKKINKTYIIKMILGALIVSVFLKVLGYIRAGNEMTVMAIVSDIMENNIIYEILYTTSTTFTTISNIFYCCPNMIPFNYGKGLLGSLLYCLPNFMRPEWISSLNIDVEKVFSPLYYNWDISGYGSSFIAEAYFNYSYLTPLFMMIFGLLIGWICKNIKQSSNNKDYCMFYFLAYLSSELFWGIRNDLFLIPRHLCLYVFIPILIAFVISSSKCKVGNRDE